MALPLYLQQFKSAGIYRVVFDKSQMPAQVAPTEILRLVVGFSEVGPFNVPVYIRNVTEFRTYFGNISKKLEKRGVWFHRLAMQALASGPILCLNLKKFENEEVDAYTMDTNVQLTTSSNTSSTLLEKVHVKVLDIYDKTRFWTLDADKLNDLKGKDGKLDKYINIAATDDSSNVATYIIRKANGSIVSGYNITLSDWYADGIDVFPEYLENYRSTLVSDYMAEVFVFNGKFTKEQVLASNSLKRFFDLNGDDLVLRPYIKDTYGNKIDTLVELFKDETSGAIGRYVGSLIPYMVNKQGAYISLDILFNQDQHLHKLMMSLNTDLLETIAEEGKPNFIDLSGNYQLIDKYDDVFGSSPTKVFSVLGNTGIKPLKSSYSFSNTVVQNPTSFEAKETYVSGDFYVTFGENIITLKDCDDDTNVVTISCEADEFDDLKKKFASAITNRVTKTTPVKDYYGKKIVNVIKNIKQESSTKDVVEYTIPNIDSFTVLMSDIQTVIVPKEDAEETETGLYDASVYEVPMGTYTIDSNNIISTTQKDDTLFSLLLVGDKLLGTNEYVYVISKEKTETGFEITLTGTPYTTANNYIILMNSCLTQENGKLSLNVVEGYKYETYKQPASTTQVDKLQWQKDILSVLNDKGIRTALLSKSDIEYRYIVDTFESYVDTEVKSVLSNLAKDRQSAFAILNFPAVQTFVKCSIASFTDANGLFNVEYVVKGCNPKKPHIKEFSLPTEISGASFCAFYTPLKFSDGYVDSIVPSAGLVSNLFMYKYSARQPYYIVAGPNYGAITASGLVGPDYNYSQDELHIIEPYGVNCMVYRPNFGTFINANQTAKQTPLSALSRVNVRELVIYLQDAVNEVLQAYQWEFNNPSTRRAILDRANSICESVQRNGGLQTYRNIMDESNNTAEVIDNEMAILSTYIEPGFGCGKMVHELTIYRTGQLSSVVFD